MAESPILLLVLTLVGLGVMVLVAKSFIDLLKQPLPPKEQQEVSAGRVILIVLAMLVAVALSVWFLFVLEPPMTVTRLISIAAMLLIVVNLRRQAAKRAAAARAAKSEQPGGEQT